MDTTAEIHQSVLDALITRANSRPNRLTAYRFARPIDPSTGERKANVASLSFAGALAARGLDRLQLWRWLGFWSRPSDAAGHASVRAGRRAVLRVLGSWRNLGCSARAVYLGLPRLNFPEDSPGTIDDALCLALGCRDYLLSFTSGRGLHLLDLDLGRTPEDVHPRRTTSSAWGTLASAEVS